MKERGRDVEREGGGERSPLAGVGVGMKIDLLAGAAVMVVAALAVGVAARFPSPGGAVPGPAVFPIGMAVLWGVAGLALLVSGVRKTTVAEPAARAGWRPWALLALAAAYAAAMPWLGFISSSALFVGLALRTLGYRHGWRAAAIGLTAGFVVYLIFGVVMSVPLPEGLLG